MPFPTARAFVLALAAAFAVSTPVAAAPHNVIIFVADGLRSRIVTPQTAPAIAALRAQGVDFQNSHSLFPTVTTPNASAIATGHRIGDTGDFGNSVYAGAAMPAPYSSSIVGLEDDTMLGLMNARFGGNYLGETSLLQAARAKGYATAVLGKHGPAAIQDVTARDGKGSIVIDDRTGSAGGIPLAPDVQAAIAAAGLPVVAPGRGANGRSGTFDTPGTLVANIDQGDWFTGVAAKALIPRFKAAGKPFVMVFWSRDPDGTQHGNGDSLQSLQPGINGPTSLAAIRNASNDLQALRDALKAQGLEADTDIIVTADHGFSTLSRDSQTSGSAKLSYAGVKPGQMPQGFLAIDLAKDLGLGLFDEKGATVSPAGGTYPRSGALLGADPARPSVVVAPNGGAIDIYLTGPDAKGLAPRIVRSLTRQDYVSAIFVHDRFGGLAGALPMSSIGLVGSALTPAPSIVVGLRNFSTGCADPELCGAEISDAGQQPGQGTHGSFGRQDTHNFMAAVGPDFKAGFVDPAPVSNADWAITVAHILGLDLHPRGKATGRVMREALAGGGPAPVSKRAKLRSKPAANGFVTELDYQAAAGQTYFDAAGMQGRTIGLRP